MFALRHPWLGGIQGPLEYLDVLSYVFRLCWSVPRYLLSCFDVAGVCIITLSYLGL